MIRAAQVLVHAIYLPLPITCVSLRGCVCVLAWMCLCGCVCVWVCVICAVGMAEGGGELESKLGDVKGWLHKCVSSKEETRGGKPSLAWEKRWVITQAQDHSRHVSICV